MTMEFILILTANQSMSLDPHGNIVSRHSEDAETFDTVEQAESVAAMYARDGLSVGISEVEE